MISIKDVAKRAGVSVATVSRVLNGSAHVDPDLKTRVHKAIKELGYQRDRVALSFRKRTSRILGLIISDIQNPFFTSVVRAIEDAAVEHDFALFLCNSDEDVDKESMYVELMLAEKVAGVVISPTRETENPARRLVESGVPVVSIDRRMRDLEVDTVVIDNVKASFELVAHLIDDGHERIGAVVGTRASSTGRERRLGYEKALLERGLPLFPELIRTGVAKDETGYREVKKLLELPQPPTGLFLGNNLLTIGGLQAIHEKALTIPGDIAVVAFDELPWMSIFRPMLTVASQPIYELGRSAASLLFDRIGNGDQQIEEVVLEATINIGQSCSSRHLEARW